MSLYDDASLIMFPSGYKEDKIYSLKPTDGSGDLTFTRASTATRVNAEGLIETSPVNLVQYSEQFENAAWSPIDATITANAATAPNGTTTADKIDLGTLLYSQIAQEVATIGENNFSIYIQSLTGTQNIYLYSYNATDGIAISPAFEIGTSWTRIDYTFNVTTSTLFGIRSEEAIAKSFYLWGAQVNLGTAKPYFPTTDRLNVPRIDYTGGGCGKLLLEPQRTNLVTYSEQFDNAVWTTSSATISANLGVAPDGTTSADKLIPDNAADPSVANASQLQQVLSVSSNTYTFSIFAKAAGQNSVRIRENNSWGNFLNVNLTTGAFNIIGGNFGQFNNIQVTPYANGWYRIAFTTEAGVTNFSKYSIRGGETGDGTSGVFFWGAQLE